MSLVDVVKFCAIRRLVREKYGFGCFFYFVFRVFYEMFECFVVAYESFAAIAYEKNVVDLYCSFVNESNIRIFLCKICYCFWFFMIAVNK